MSEIELTKDSDALICAIYKEYLQRRKSGVPKGDAKSFYGAEKIQKEIVPNWQLADVEETCWELNRKGFLSCRSSNNTIYQAVLQDEAIIYMENRFQNGLSEVLNYLEKIKSILLW